MEGSALGRGGELQRFLLMETAPVSADHRQARAQRPKSLTHFIPGLEEVEKTLASQTSIFPSPTF